MSTISEPNAVSKKETTEGSSSPSAADSADKSASEAGSVKILNNSELAKSYDSEIDKLNRPATSSSSGHNTGECDEIDDLLSDYTSETTFFDAERSGSTLEGRGEDKLKKEML